MIRTVVLHSFLRVITGNLVRPDIKKAGPVLACALAMDNRNNCGNNSQPYQNQNWMKSGGGTALQTAGRTV
jgi:hypothetical protein